MASNSRNIELRHRTIAHENKTQTEKAGNFHAHQRSAWQEERSPSRRNVPEQEVYFRYNQVVAAVIVPCLLVVAVFGGQATVLVAILGLMVTYIFDLTQSKEGTVFCLWLTVFAGVGTLIYNSALNVPVFGFARALRAGTFVIFSVLLGLWGTLQFKWIYLEAPASMATMERLLISCLPVPAASILTSGLIVVSGPRHAANFFALVLFYNLSQLGMQLPSSFQSWSKKADKEKVVELKIHGTMDTAILSISLLILPVLVHISFFHAELFSITALASYSGAGWGFGAAGARIVLAVSVLCCWLLVRRGAISWMDISSDVLETSWAVLGMASLSCLVYELEKEVLLEAVRPYVVIPAPEDFYCLIGLSGLCLLSALLMMVSGRKGRARSTGITVLSALLNMSAAFLLCRLFGTPHIVTLSSITGALCLAVFSVWRYLLWYFFFSCCFGVWLLWFGFNTLGFLEFKLAFGDLTSSGLALALSSIAALGTFVPGVLWLRRSQGLLGLVLSAYLIGVALAEVCLIDGANQLYDPSEAYPLFLVFLTALVGIWVTFALRSQNAIGPIAHWVGGYLSLGKLIGVLVMVAQSGPVPLHLSKTLPACCLTLFSVTAPYVFRESVDASHSGPTKMSVWQGSAHFVVMGVGLTKFAPVALIPILRLCLSRTPSLATLVACVVSIWGSCFLFMTISFFRTSIQGRRFAGFMLLSGLLIQLVQPELRPEHLLKSFNGLREKNMVSMAAESGSNWASIWLIVAGLTMLLGAMGVVKVPETALARVLYSGTIGAPLGLYISTTFVEAPDASVHAVFAIMAACLAYILSNSLSSSPSSSALVLQTFTCYVGVGVYGYIKQAYLVGIYKGLHDASMGQIYFQSNKILFAFSAIGSTVIAISLKHLVSTQSSPAKKGTQKSGVIAANTRISSWIPLVGNGAAMFAFLAALFYVRTTMGGIGSAFLTPFVCSLLLFLQKDTLFFQRLDSTNAMAPVGTACTLVLSCFVVHALLIRGFVIPGEVGEAPVSKTLEAQLSALNGNTERWKDFSIWTASSASIPVLHIMLTLGCYPSIFLCLRYLWTHKSAANLVLAATAPLGLVATFLSGLSEINVLGMVGFIGSIFQYVVTTESHSNSMRLI